MLGVAGWQHGFSLTSPATHRYLICFCMNLKFGAFCRCRTLTQVLAVAVLVTRGYALRPLIIGASKNKPPFKKSPPPRDLRFSDIFHKRLRILNHAFLPARRHVIAIATCPSVCLSVRPSVTSAGIVKKKKPSGKISSPSGSPMILVF